MLQMVRTLLSDPDDGTRLSLVLANRHLEDILMKDELDKWALSHPDRFRVRYVLSSPPDSWQGGVGWVDVADVKAGLPAPGDSTLIMVCGTDGFLDTVSGPTVRGPPLAGKKQGPKLQGPLTGVLQSAGYKEEMVYKF